MDCTIICGRKRFYLQHNSIASLLDYVFLNFKCKVFSTLFILPYQLYCYVLQIQCCVLNLTQVSYRLLIVYNELIMDIS